MGVAHFTGPLVGGVFGVLDGPLFVGEEVIVLSVTATLELGAVYWTGGRSPLDDIDDAWDDPVFGLQGG